MLTFVDRLMACHVVSLLGVALGCRASAIIYQNSIDNRHKREHSAVDCAAKCHLYSLYTIQRTPRSNMRESTATSFRGKDHCESEREEGWPGENLQGDDWISSKMYIACLDLFRQKLCGVLTCSELSKLSTKDAGPLVPSVSGPSMLNLKCPAFLKIFITDLQYGRKLGKWEQCHVKTEGWGSLVCLSSKQWSSSRLPPQCLDNSLLDDWRSKCLSRSNCAFKVVEGFVQMDRTCEGKMEMRTEHICGKNRILLHHSRILSHFPPHMFMKTWVHSSLIQIMWATNCIPSELCPLGLLGQRWFLRWWFPPGEQMNQTSNK